MNLTEQEKHEFEESDMLSQDFVEWWTQQGGTHFWHPTATKGNVWSGCYLLNANRHRLTYQGHDLIVAFEFATTNIQIWLMDDEEIPCASLDDVKDFLNKHVLPIEKALCREHDFKYVRCTQ
jgi:hypothetical protein